MKTSAHLPVVVLTGASLLFTVASQAADWPQWRGPSQNGVAPNANPPTFWSESSNVVWKIAVPGSGTSTPIIWGKHIFLLAAEALPSANQAPVTNAPAPQATTNAAPGGNRRGGGGGRSEAPTNPYRFTVNAFDRTTGKVLWQKTAVEEVPHEAHHRDHGFASASPVTDGEHVYAWFGSRGMHCYDFSGKLKWSQRFGKMQTRNSFGEGSSPALHGDTLVVLWDHEGEDFITALDKRTGQEKWRQPRSEGTGWTTPLIVTYAGQTQVLISAANRIRSYALDDGKLLWECAGMTANPIPTPVADADTAYFISGFRGAALLAIKLGGTGDLTGTDFIRWSHNKSTPYVPSPLLYDDFFYFLAGNNATLSCLDAKTGKAHYEAERLEGVFGMYASPVGAGGRIYLAGRDGKCAVIKNSPTLEVLAVNALDDKFDASPAVVGNELFLRGHKSLYCISEAAKP